MSLAETAVAPRPGDTPEAALARSRELLEVCIALNAARDLDALFAALMRTTTRVLRCEASAVLLHDAAENVLRFAGTAGAGSDVLVGTAVPLDGSLAGTLFRENRPLLAVDLAHDARHYAAASARTGVLPHTLLGVPMRVDGEVVGVLQALNPHAADGAPEGAAPVRFDRADAEALLVIAAQAAVALRAARQQAALADANARLERLDATREQFLTLASHELRTPLATMRGYADVLADEAPPALAPFLSEMRAAGARMQSVVETLEEMAWLRSDGALPATGRVALGPLLADVCAEVGRPVETDLSAAPSVRADPQRLRTAVLHLVRNAAQFTPEGGRVRVAASADGANARIAVTDTGRGIDAAHLDRIFEPFFQVEAPDARSHEGLGVGLAIARAVAVRHGGALWAASAGAGQGATFHLRLPLAA